MIGRNVSFLTKLAESSRARDSIVCVGLDPEPDLIPEMLGSGPQAALRFLRRVIRATSDYACAYKPNLAFRSEEHTSELQSRQYLVCRLLLEKKNRQPYPFAGAKDFHCAAHRFPA